MEDGRAVQPVEKYRVFLKRLAGFKKRIWTVAALAFAPGASHQPDTRAHSMIQTEGDLSGSSLFSYGSAA